MSFKEVIEACKAIAIDKALTPDEETVYRSICRSYSKKFHVPLPEVFKMDPVEVVTTEFESQLDELDMEKNGDAILEQIYTLEDPEYQSKKEEEVKEFMADAEEKEEERLREGRPIHPELRKEFEETKLPDSPAPEKKPKSGSLSFSQLKDEG